MEIKQNVVSLNVNSFATAYSTSQKTSKISEMCIQEFNKFFF